MINLTFQQIFDKSASHLLTQNEKSLSSDKMIAMYKSPKGLYCAIGIFFGDLYKKRFESKAIFHLNLDEKLFPVEQEHFLRELQKVHDCNEPKSWKECLNNLAKKWNLSDLVCQESYSQILVNS